MKEMDQHSELQALAKVTVWVAVSMTYARFVASRVRPGGLRFLSLFPVLCLLPFLPFHFSSLHLRGISAFFLVWLAIFKLLLLSAAAGPLSADLSLPAFLVSAVLPVKLINSHHHHHHQQQQRPKGRPFTSLLLPSAVKVAILASIIPLYRFKDLIHPYLLLSLYSIHMYLALEVVLAGAAAAASILLPGGLQLEPQFDEPYRASSLQDFWGRRWNIMVSAILRPSVYLPVRARCGRAAAVLAAFLVSGLMHEVMFWYLTLAPPTGEATAFFLIHGACVVAEEAARKSGCWQPPAAVATLLTLGLVATTGFWLFFPPILRSRADEVVLAECAAAMGFLEAACRKFLAWIGLF
ncbi:putative long-chain-alcohol O-fatty-acyltransferase 5 [Canna indica]|uniref:Long-chain-alcohol O-fatty-acyltransferase 5 n=1 Tax=Canna indica TaxID=4628 RepID=A0AAQ3QCS1_9LILI|nr:putative long-chain-alcohol O-fatty-acyltransferase 5 [Canna indica]